MRTPIVFAAAALTLGLAACALTPAQITADIATVQQDCEEACQVIPNALDVASLISAAFPSVSAGAAELASISQAICNAIGPAPAAARFRFAKSINGNGRVFKVWTPPPTNVNVNGQVIPVHFL